MTTEDQERIERNRKTSSSQELTWMQTIYRNTTGNTLSTGCFCKSTNKDLFLSKFYAWYDANYPKA